MIKLHNFFILFVSILPSITSQKLTCKKSCPGSRLNPLPYPLGFSPGCEIQLNCTSEGTVLIGEFFVIQITMDELLVSLPTKCGRPIDALSYLYGDHYAPTSANAILMQNCTERMTTCLAATSLKTVNCSSLQDGFGNVSCYTDDASTRMFLDYVDVTRMACRNLLSVVAWDRNPNDHAVTLDVQAVKLGWWLKGTCDCSNGADCTKIVSPTDGSDGYRCKCKSGFQGDGYKDSSGCQEPKGSKGAARKLIVLIGFACSIAGILLLVVILCWKKRLWATRNSSNHQVEIFIRNYGALALKRFKYSDIKKMTNSFIEKLGQGGFGTVYKGQSPDGQLVAVKLLTEAHGDGEDFINEVASIGRTSHVNIVALLGFCVEGKKRALMYEFMPNGSLDKFLRGDGSHLDWNTLFEIAKGIARGLEYLHRGCNTRIVHFDIKPHNILLNKEFVPKISDFGLAKLCKTKESIVSVRGARGTAGYMAPEVFFKSLGGASHKSDVYSYGMMVLEMTGVCKKNNAVGISTSESYFPDWIYKQVEIAGNLEDYGVTTKEEEELARKMMIVSLWCIQSDPSDRPSIGKVMEMLDESFESLQVPPRYFWSSPSRPA